jgi:GMP synthase (glutamine-hydrolysing)
MILIVDCGSSKVPLIEQIVDEVCDYHTISILDFNEQLLGDVDGVIISGAPLLITEQHVQPYLDKLTWLRKTTIPVLGICFGHQLIGLTFGAFASRMKEDRDWQTIEVFEESPLFEKLSNEIEVMEDHCETVSIPAGFKLLASSDACVNEAMQHVNMPIFGVQFHPEVSGNVGFIIIENFMRVALKKDRNKPF